MMRLCLSIQRHELPEIKILWHLPAECSTISKLLEQVSDVIPLESDGWGIEDYAVQVNGYECLHYLDPHSILNENDQVCVRALQTSDIRVRTLSGRHQISAAGAHLIDGIAFGRSYLRRPDRPPIHIPPRKRRRMSYDYHGEQGLESSTGGDYGRQLRLTATFDDADGMDVDAEESEPDFEPEHASSFTHDLLPETGRLRSGKRRKSVSFDESSSSAAPSFNIFEDGGNDDESDDEEFEARSDVSRETNTRDEAIDANVQPLRPFAKSTKSHGRKVTSVKRLKSQSHSSASSTTSTSGSSSPGSSSDASSDDSNSSSDSSNSSDNSSADTSSSDSSSASSGDEADESATLSNKPPGKAVIKAPRDAKKTQHTSQPQQPSRTPPGKGSQSTRSRNERRRHGRKMKYLQRMGLTEYSVKEEGVSTRTLPAEKPSASAELDFERRRQDLLDAIASGGVDIDDDLSQRPSANNSEGMGTLADVRPISMEVPEVSMAGGDQEVETGQQRSGQEPAHDDSTNTMNISGQLIAPGEADTTSTPLAISTTAKEELEAKKRRSKLDVASSRRLLFGSLGVRTPRNKADEEKLRTHLSEKAKRSRKTLDSSKSAANTESGAAEHDIIGLSNVTPDVDAWKGKITLTAVECCEKGVVLSTPPFPFVQRWDPQQQFPKGGTRGKKRKRKSQHFEDYQEPSRVEETYLEYDDPPDEYPIGYTNDDDEVTSQLQQEIIKSSQEAEDDLPSLPLDMSSLSDLKPLETQPNAVIAFKQLECSQETNWQPIISRYRTALIDSVDSELHLTLAKRDYTQQQERYNEDGNRIYGKFELVDEFPDEDEDQDDDHHDMEPGKLFILATDLIEPKLVRAAPNSTSVASAREEDGNELGSQIVIVQDSMAPETEESGETAQDSMFTNENVAPDDDSHDRLVDGHGHGSLDLEIGVEVESAQSQQSSADFVDAPVTQSVTLGEGLMVVS